MVATSTLAAYVSYSDLGVYIFAGLNTNNDVESFCGALLVALLSACADLALLALYRLATPGRYGAGNPRAGLDGGAILPSPAPEGRRAGMQRLERLCLPAAPVLSRCG